MNIATNTEENDLSALRIFSIKALPLAAPLQEIIYKIIDLDHFAHTLDKVVVARKEILELHIAILQNKSVVKYLCNLQYDPYVPRYSSYIPSDRLQPANLETKVKFDQLYAYSIKEKLDVYSLSRKTFTLGWKGADLLRWGQIPDWHDEPLWDENEILKGLKRCTTAEFYQDDAKIPIQENPKFTQYKELITEIAQETQEIVDFSKVEIANIRESLKTDFVERTKIHVARCRVFNEIVNKVEEIENNKIIESTIYEVIDQALAGDALSEQESG